jgi:hypothetical protein
MLIDMSLSAPLSGPGGQDPATRRITTSVIIEERTRKGHVSIYAPTRTTLRKGAIDRIRAIGAVQRQGAQYSAPTVLWKLCPAKMACCIFE